MDDPIAGVEDLSRFCCLNPRCADRGRRGAGNLSVCMRYGKRETHRLLYCRTCKARFSERKGTPLFNARLPTAKAVSVLEHLAEGCGVRQTGRLAKVSRGAVGRLCRVAGGHAEALHEERVALSPSDRGGAVRREVVVRRQEAGPLRRR
jgi:transposase-like protein